MSHANDFMISAKQADANATWETMVAALREIGLKTDEAKSHYSSTKEKLATDESDTRISKGRLIEAILLPEHVEKINILKLDTGKTEGPWLITSKSVASLTPGW